MGTRREHGTVIEPGSESARERTRRAIEAAERADQVIAESTRRRGRGRGRLLKLVLLAAVVAGVVAVVRKLSDQGDGAGAPTPAAPPTDAPAAEPARSAAGQPEASARPDLATVASRNGDHPDDDAQRSEAATTGDEPTR